MILKAVENEFKKAEAIIDISEKLIAKGMNIDLSALHRISSSLRYVMRNEYADQKKYAGFLKRMNDINLSVENLSKQINCMKETDNVV